MSEAKPHEATPSRRARAAREGNVALAPEPVALAAFGGALIALASSGPAMSAAARAALVESALHVRGNGIAPALLQLGFLACVPLVAGGACATLAAVALRGGLRMRTLSLALSNLNPGAGLKRLLSRETLLAAVRAAVAFAACSLILASVLRAVFAASIGARSVEEIAVQTIDASARCCIAVLLTGLVFSGADVAFARVRWLRTLRMSHDELKRDLRESEGDPLQRGRRTSAHRRLLRGSLRRVREAAFVVTNPTHIAVALAYAPPAVEVPEILVRACDEGAGHVKALAREYGVPLVENVALARALFAAGSEGTIPRETYVAVAEVVASLVRSGAFT